VEEFDQLEEGGIICRRRGSVTRVGAFVDGTNTNFKTNGCWVAHRGGEKGQSIDN